MESGRIERGVKKCWNLKWNKKLEREKERFGWLQQSARSGCLVRKRQRRSSMKQLRRAARPFGLPEEWTLSIKYYCIYNQLLYMF
jgi:hypothetical protein